MPRRSVAQLEEAYDELSERILDLERICRTQLTKLRRLEALTELQQTPTFGEMPSPFRDTVYAEINTLLTAIDNPQH